MLLILGIIFLLIAFSGSSEPKYINQREDYYDDEEDYDDEYEYEKVQDITESEVVKKTDDEENHEYKDRIPHASGEFFIVCEQKEPEGQCNLFSNIIETEK